MKHLKTFESHNNNNDNDNDNNPFRSELLHKDSNMGKYTLYVDESTGWGIIFPNGYIEVEEGPHSPETLRVNGEINGVSFSQDGDMTFTIPSEYWMGELSQDELIKRFDKMVGSVEIAKQPFRFKM